ncbi:DNA gyrase inhibitor YacG [Ruegeria sp. A3M17]|uniref:DNA gyrase inhibitor YacG n=1 Tax=Ruegeria sp. A3M17 TaxID=2267229 RepID=UPI000DEBE010|nr:DNA gyrase inhibitor YacG [Ruegeria sp. A3M17]RBW58765.1 DNA gyrase inhibitor YacG [Ruegeria sp. A3M17]
MSCPICAEKSVTEFRPFCSRRCADIDLAKWLNGSYAVPSQREEDVETEVSDPEAEQQRPH